MIFLNGVIFTIALMGNFLCIKVMVGWDIVPPNPSFERSNNVDLWQGSSSTFLFFADFKCFNYNFSKNNLGHLTLII